MASFCITQITFKLISRYQITKIFSQVALKIFSKYSPRLPSSPPQPIPAKGAHQLYPRVPGRKKVSVRSHPPLKVANRSSWCHSS